LTGAAGYATGGTTIFNREPCCVEIDEELVFDAYTDYLGVDPVYDTSFANLDDGPIFDEELFIDPIVDATPDSDPAAVTVLNLATSVCVVRGQEPDDLADGPVFDANPDGLEAGPVFDTYFHDRGDSDLATGVDFVDDPLFDEEHEHEEAELIPYKYVIIGSNIATPATFINAPSTCSTKFPLHAVDTTAWGSVDMETKKAMVLHPIGWVFNQYCSSIGNYAGSVQRNHGGLFIADSKRLIHVRGVVTSSLVEYRSVLPDFVEANEIETKF
jgi:hypothetical protein